MKKGSKMKIIYKKKIMILITIKMKIIIITTITMMIMVNKIMIKVMKIMTKILIIRTLVKKTYKQNKLMKIIINMIQFLQEGVVRPQDF